MQSSAPVQGGELLRLQGEELLRQRLRDYLVGIGQPEPDRNVDELFNLRGGFVSRFDFFAQRIDDAARDAILISGCAVGSEAIVAREYGFRSVAGTEVEPIYIDIARERLRGNAGFRFDLYDGERLPYPDDAFSMVLSGHIIEHTRSPADYLREHFRILRPGGFFFLEFPTRYHWKELHTNLPSVEYLPRGFRAWMLRFLSSRASPLPERMRHGYRVILETGLQPVSTRWVRSCLRSMGDRPPVVVHRYYPAPGVVRMLIRKPPA
ncbi:class I SAM-dependent methyltransferase [Thioalkalivibrio paradoxus]|nr:class I SAM-dependent methyltransferase [Thioalkalivibrio paradoxus]